MESKSLNPKGDLDSAPNLITRMVKALPSHSKREGAILQNLSKLVTQE
jgi:hypothetical protein